MKFDFLGFTLPVLAIGLAAEVVLPYVLLMLSDLFMFDIPDWALWFAFGGPPVASVATLAGKFFKRRVYA